MLKKNTWTAIKIHEKPSIVVFNYRSDDTLKTKKPFKSLNWIRRVSLKSKIIRNNYFLTCHNLKDANLFFHSNQKNLFDSECAENWQLLGCLKRQWKEEWESSFSFSFGKCFFSFCQLRKIQKKNWKVTFWLKKFNLGTKKKIISLHIFCIALRKVVKIVLPFQRECIFHYFGIYLGFFHRKYIFSILYLMNFDFLIQSSRKTL
jgi:hypothetical protein